MFLSNDFASAGESFPGWQLNLAAAYDYCCQENQEQGINVEAFSHSFSLHNIFQLHSKLAEDIPNSH
jgi:hypothetical protein